mgnify:CR=1 FL=1
MFLTYNVDPNAADQKALLAVFNVWQFHGEHYDRLVAHHKKQYKLVVLCGIAMETEVFEELMMTVLVGGLILFMAFIVWDLAKKSKAGRYGTAVLFFALGLGVLGFIIKTVVIAVKGL